MTTPRLFAKLATVFFAATLLAPACDKQKKASGAPAGDATEEQPPGDDAGAEPTSEERAEDMSAPGHDMEKMGEEKAEPPPP